VDAEVCHYGWVRPPRVMQRKRAEFTAAYVGRAAAEERHRHAPPAFDYGPLNRLPRFHGTHPAALRAWVAAMDWREQLDYAGVSKARHKHDRLKYRLVTFIEQHLLGGRQLGGFRNYRLLRRFGPG
jgi:hypothetical protein